MKAIALLFLVLFVQSADLSPQKVANLLAEALQPVSVYETEYDVLIFPSRPVDEKIDAAEEVRSVTAVRWVADASRLRVEESETFEINGRARQDFLGIWDGERYVTRTRKQIALFSEPRRLMIDCGWLFAGGPAVPIVGTRRSLTDSVRRGTITEFRNDDTTLFVKWNHAGAAYECEVDLSRRHVSRYTVTIGENDPTIWRYWVADWTTFDETIMPKVAVRECEYTPEDEGARVRRWNQQLYQRHSWRKFEAQDDEFMMEHEPADVVRDIDRKLAWIVGRPALQIDDVMYDTSEPVWDDPDPAFEEVRKRQQADDEAAADGAKRFGILLTGGGLTILAFCGFLAWRFRAKVAVS